MAVAPDGSLWIVQEGEGAANPAKVLHCDRTGATLAGQISGMTGPRGIAVSKSGLIYVTDTGVDQNVKIYKQDGTLHGTFGDLKGIYGGVKGAIAPLKLNNPVGVGLDNDGHIWVACNGPKTPWADLAGGTGAELRKYTLEGGAVQWERFGLEYVDCGSGDPGTDGVDVFTKHNHYLMDYSKPAGSQWTYQGMTLDQFTYPSDPRLLAAPLLGPAMVRRIKGDRYLFVTDQQGGWLRMFRFEKGSEIAIPCGYMQRETDRGRRDNHFGIWHDANGNGSVDAGELDLGGAPAGAPSNENYCFSIDNKGDVWTADAAGIRCYTPLADASGHIYYSSTRMRAWPCPAAFTGPGAVLTRVYYDADRDEMYLAGYTSDAPKRDTAFGLIGTRIIKYGSFQAAGAQREIYRIAVPRDAATKVGARAMDIGGGYVGFVLAITAEVYLYDSASGRLAARLYPGPEVSRSGWVDCNNGMQLFPRSNGELLVFVEEDNEAKILVHRYDPRAGLRAAQR
jgi:hypothetical protein